MNVPQIARDHVTQMNDPEKIKGCLTAEATASGSVIPQPIPNVEVIKLLYAASVNSAQGRRRS